MFTINYSTVCGKEKSMSIIDEEYATTIFNLLIQAADVKEVVVINGLTGEVIIQWENGRFILF